MGTATGTAKDTPAGAGLCFAGPARRHAHLLNPDLIAPVTLLLLGILFFADFLFSSKNFYYRDILNFHYPLRKVLIDAYGRWELPLWNPFVSLGQPMLANPNYMAFYPTNLLHLFLPFHYAFKLHFILHPLLAGTGMYFLCRRLGLSVLAAFGGALGYQFSGTVISFLNLYNVVPGVAFLPWLGWAFLGAVAHRSARRTLLYGALLALQVLALEPLIFLGHLWMLAGLSIYSVLESADRRAAVKAVLRAAIGGGIFAAGLSAVQVLPTLELLPLSVRAAYDFQAMLWSMHPLDLLNCLIPNLFGDPYTIDHSTYWGEAFHDGREGYLVSYFLGSCMLLLALLAPASGKRYLKYTAAGMAGLGILLALGSSTPFYETLLRSLPFGGMGRYPSKYFLVATFSICLLAALGLETLIDRPQERRRRAWMRAAALGGLALSAALLIIWLVSLHDPSLLERWVTAALPPDSLRTKKLPWIASALAKSILSSAAFLGLSSLLVLLRRSWKNGVLGAALLLFLALAELVPANIRLSPLISDEAMGFVPDVYRYVETKLPKEAYRALSMLVLDPAPRVAIHASRNSSAWLTLLDRWVARSYFGISQGIQYSLNDPVDNLGTQESEQLRLACRRLPDDARLEAARRLNAKLILSVRDLEHDGLRRLASFETPSDQILRLYWLEQAAPRAYFVAQAETVRSHEEALARFLSPGFSWDKKVILEGGTPGDSTAEPASGSVSLERSGASRISCRVAAGSAGYLVLLDSYYPGWEAYVDGVRSEVMRANYAFRAVRVPAGNHEVVFRFRSRSFSIGALVTLASLSGGLIMLAVQKRQAGGRRPHSAA